MQIKCSLLCGAAFGVLLTVGIGADAQAKPKHHHHMAAGPSALEAKVDTLTNAVSDLESRLNDASQAEQATQVEVEAAKADAAAARAQAADAQSQLAEQIQTIPGQVDNSITAHLPKPSNVKLTVGGFAAFETVTRTRNEQADIGSNYSKIPYLNSQLAHLGETRFTARQSRLSLLAQADINPTTHTAFYSEFDFLADAQTGNSNESNSYSPRIRHVYGTVDWDNLGLHVLAGQTWSLATMNTQGITPRHELTPPTIDAQYVAGFVWARQPQIRVVKDFGKQVWLAVSLENPQTTFAGSVTGLNATAPGVLANTGNAGISLLSNANTFSYNHIPDVIAKVSFDPMIGGKQPLHVEAFGLWRDFYDRVTYTSGNPLGIVIPTNPSCFTGATAGSTGTTKAVCTNTDTSGYGFGAGVVWNAVPKLLDVQGSFITGRGIGRYGSGQLPDTVVAENGSLQPIPETMFLVGGTLHPTPNLDIYVMYGQEREGTEALYNHTTTFLGYGNPAATLAGCAVEGVACSTDTQQIDQITAGVWDKVYAGKFGSVRIGFQYSHTDLTGFPGVTGSSTPGVIGTSPGVGSSVTPKTNDDMFFTSFRFYPNF